METFLPHMIGTEEERRMAMFSGENLKDFNKASAITKSVLLIPYVLQSQPTYRASAYHHFLHNGSKVYDDNGLEIATPECLTPQSTAKYLKANAQIVEKAAVGLLKDRAVEYDTPYSMLLSRRTVDTHGTTWACHDNFSFVRKSFMENIVSEDSALGALWKAYLHSRGFITGAGLINHDGWHYSQKMSVDQIYSNHAHAASLLRTEQNEGKRLEIRCSDVNLRDWGTVIRLGSAALLLAVSQSEAAEKLSERIIKQFPLDFHSVRSNALALNSKLELVDTDTAVRALNTQRLLHGLILANYKDWTDQPLTSRYSKIAQHILQYCDDYEYVLKGKADLSILADRSDWANKFTRIRGAIHNKDVPYNGAIAQQADVLYDAVLLTAFPEGTHTSVRGSGFQPTKTDTLKANEVSQAACCPPAGTRAAKRTMLAERYRDNLKYISWSYIDYKYGNSQKRISF